MFVNFEYEIHITRGGKPYVRGFLESITNEPKYKVFNFDLDAYDAVLVDGNEEETIENAENAVGYTMKYEEFTIEEGIECI